MSDKMTEDILELYKTVSGDQDATIESLQENLFKEDFIKPAMIYRDIPKGHILDGDLNDTEFEL